MALSEEEAEKIAQIMREELPQKKTEKPPFAYGRHLYWSIMSGGLWAPVWLVLSLRHDYKWKKSQRDKKD